MVNVFFFGFTNCPHMCPMTMIELSHMYDKLQQNSVSPLPQVVLISIDPERDTIEKLNNYVTSFNPHFVGVTGSQGALGSIKQGTWYCLLENQQWRY